MTCIRRALLALMVSALSIVAARAQYGSFAFDYYPNTSDSQMVALYRYVATIDAADVPVSPSCMAGTCSWPAPMFPTGTTHTLTLRVACAATPTLFGPATPPLTWTVGGPPPPPLSYPPAPPNPCAPVVPPPPPPDTPPSIDSLSVGRRTGNTYPVTATITDDVLVEHVEFWVDNFMQVRLVAPTTAPSTWATRVQIKFAGEHPVVVRAFDSVGKQSQATITVRR